MQITEITQAQGNGDYVIAPPSKFKEGTVYVITNTDSATLTFGVMAEGTFVAFPDGVITDARLLRHGADVAVAVNVASIGANTIKIGYAGL